MRNWLEHLNVNKELAKVLSKMVIEVKTEIRFRPTEDGKIVPEATNDVKVKSRRAEVNEPVALARGRQKCEPCCRGGVASAPT